MKFSKFKKVIFKTYKGIKELLPMLLGIIIIVAMLKEGGVFQMMSQYVQDDIFDVFIADIFWSISAGNTINSYIIADSFGDLEEYMLVITTFLIAWVTVGFVQIPAEIYFFGKRFTFIRNIISFIFALLWAYLVYFFYYL